MAWHDNKWDGAVCSKPEANVYCIGTHSLLSGRLAREKKLNIENKNPNKKLDEVKEDPPYFPPCFWSTNAFSPQPAKITHVHLFNNLKHKPIPDRLEAYSVYSWPFRISYNHSKAKQTKEGRYPKDLEKRVEKFQKKFKEDKSIVFFYLNYSNPVSADEHKYALVGCAVLKSVGDPTFFPFDEKELKPVLSGPGMQNFSRINWALQFSYDFTGTGIVLPYQEYLHHIEQHPEDEQKLDEMKVLIEEEALIQHFKYVAEELDDDKCIYLLYKLQKGIGAVQRHGIVKFDKEEERIENLLETAWANRGLYPSLDKITELLADPDSEEQGEGEKLVTTIREHLASDDDILETVFGLLKTSERVPDYLQESSYFIEAARSGLRAHSSLADLLKKLSLFSLTKFQLRRIIFPAAQEKHPFGGKEFSPDNLIANPYLLCENYIPIQRDLDQFELHDGPIGVFTIDIGMFPDKNYIKKINIELQNLHPEGPERLRALIIDYLHRIKSDGHCFAALESLYESIQQHPLFYKQKLYLNKQELVRGEHRKHFEDRLTVIENDRQFYFYLREVKYAEELIEKVITSLISRREEHALDLDWIDSFLERERQEVQREIPDFPVKQFLEERKQLLEGTLRRSFFIITGKPGSGKTQALKKVIEELQELGENVTLLAPTGKATLRLKEETGFQEAQTIDMLLYHAGYGYCLIDFENILGLQRDSKTLPIQNLIVDECSMVDLQKLATLFAILDREGANAVKRVILVGDENQLPPIGCGRPFFDIIEFLKSKEQTRTKHFVRLVTNCRQKFDKKILSVADIFAGRNRYYEELLEELGKGGQISEGLIVDHWRTQEELFQKIDARLCEVITREIADPTAGGKSEGLNQLFGLYASGFVQKKSPLTLKLDKFQMITPYNAGYYGTIGLNQLIRGEYKKDYVREKNQWSVFGHSEKVIRLYNWYWKRRNSKGRDLVLSNGSIGVVCNHKVNGNVKQAWYFPDRTTSLRFIDDEENFALAYAITVHKAQGSEFENVFAVIPEKRGLLSRELLYTALSRSTRRVTIFLQQSERESPIEVARRRSFVLDRNTSLFRKPEESQSILEPEPGVKVKSRIEYIIYRALMEKKGEGRLNFKYEEELPLKNKSYVIHPDFTIWVNGRTYYWEHLGVLDQREYSMNWKERCKDYKINGYEDTLLTTDDLNGIRQELIQRVVQNIIEGKIVATPDSPFSRHHYQLY